MMMVMTMPAEGDVERENSISGILKKSNCVQRN